MSVQQAIAGAARAGATLYLDGEQGRCRAPKGALSPELRARLTEHRDELRHLLALTPESPEYAAALVGVGQALGWGQVERRPRRCYACRTVNWRERPTGGWVCDTCHPATPRPARTPDTPVATPLPSHAHEGP